MDVKLLLLINCAALVYCQNTTDPGHDGESWANKFFKALRHEMEATRQLLSSQQKTGVFRDRQMMKEMKSEIQDIRQIVSDQNQMVENIRNRLYEIDMTSELQSVRQLLMDLKQSPVRRESHTRQRLKKKSEIIDEIREVVAEQQNGSGNDSRKGCPHGFDYLPEVDSCFKFISDAMTWKNAIERCRQLRRGASLAAITSRKENDAIVRYLQMQSSIINKDCNSLRWPGAGNVIWIGGQTRNANRCGDPYVWKTQRGIEIPFNYTNWYQKDPDCFESKENCAQIVTGRNYKWNDGDCDSLSCAICELHM